MSEDVQTPPTILPLMDGMDVVQRRRFWLLAQIITRLSVDDDLEVIFKCVETLEDFIINGARTRVAREKEVRTPLLDETTRRRFVEEAIQNPDNRRLATRFGLSVRQAHAIRVALRKEIMRQGRVDVASPASSAGVRQRLPTGKMALRPARIGDSASPSMLTKPLPHASSSLRVGPAEDTGSDKSRPLAAKEMTATKAS